MRFDFPMRGRLSQKNITALPGDYLLRNCLAALRNL
jgi:hypothetical protein